MLKGCRWLSKQFADEGLPPSPPDLAEGEMAVNVGVGGIDLGGVLFNRAALSRIVGYLESLPENNPPKVRALQGWRAYQHSEPLDLMSRLLPRIASTCTMPTTGSCARGSTWAAALS
jgi:hypothetical protein